MPYHTCAALPGLYPPPPIPRLHQQPGVKGERLSTWLRTMHTELQLSGGGLVSNVWTNINCQSANVPLPPRQPISTLLGGFVRLSAAPLLFSCLQLRVAMFGFAEETQEVSAVAVNLCCCATAVCSAPFLPESPHAAPVRPSIHPSLCRPLDGRDIISQE